MAGCIGKKKDLEAGMWDCQDREKTEIGGGECTQKGKRQLGGDGQKVETHAGTVFCDDLKILDPRA